MRNTSKAEIARRALGKLRGKGCWYVSCGRNVGSSFQLYLGKMVRREKALGRPEDSRVARKAAAALPRSVREHAPEYGLLVWCSWRLSRRGSVVLTSDDCENELEPREKQIWLRLSVRRMLMGATIRELKIVSPFFDLKLVFDNGYQLDVLCDRGKAKPRTDPRFSPIASNWEIFVPDDFVVGV